MYNFWIVFFKTLNRTLNVLTLASVILVFCLDMWLFDIPAPCQFFVACGKFFYGVGLSFIAAYIGTVVKRLKLYNRLIVNVIENSYLCIGKKNTSNRPRKAEFGGIAKINLHGKGTKFLRNITGSSVHRV